MKEEKILQWNYVEKNKISNFAAIFLYTQISFTTLSLSLSLSLNLKKDKSQAKDIYIRGLSNYYMFWRLERCI